MNGHGHGGEMEVIEQDRQVIVQTLGGREIQLQGSVKCDTGNQNHGVMEKEGFFRRDLMRFFFFII